MTTLLEYIDTLHKKKYSWSHIKMYIFNNLQVSNNIPSERCKNAYLNFTINNGTMSTVEILLKYLKNLEEQYPHIVKNVSYHGIRHGGSADSNKQKVHHICLNFHTELNKI